MAIKTNSLLIHATMWTDLRNMTLSERRHEQMTYSVIPFLRHSKGGKSYQHGKKQIRGGPSWEWGRAKHGLFRGHKELSVGGNVPDLHCDGGYGCLCLSRVTDLLRLHTCVSCFNKVDLKKKNTVRRGTLIRLYRRDWTM